MPPLQSTDGGYTGPRPTMPQRDPYVPQQPTQRYGVDNNSAQPSGAANGRNHRLAQLTPQQAALARGPYIDPREALRNANGSRKLFGAGTSTLRPRDTNPPLNNIPSRIPQEAGTAGYTDPRQAIGPYISGPLARAYETAPLSRTEFDIHVNSILFDVSQQMNIVLEALLSPPSSSTDDQLIECAVQSHLAIQDLQQNFAAQTDEQRVDALCAISQQLSQLNGAEVGKSKLAYIQRQILSSQQQLQNRMQKDGSMKPAARTQTAAGEQREAGHTDGSNLAPHFEDLENPRSFYASTLTDTDASQIAELPPAMESTLSELNKSINFALSTIESAIQTNQTIENPSSRPYVDNTEWPSAKTQLSKANEDMQRALMYATFSDGDLLSQDEAINNIKTSIMTAKAHIASAPGDYAGITEIIHITERNLKAFETASKELNSAQEAMTGAEEGGFIESKNLILGDTVQIPKKYAITAHINYGKDTHTVDARCFLVDAALAGASLSNEKDKQVLNIEHCMFVEVSTLANALGLESREIVDIWLQDLEDYDQSTPSHLQTTKKTSNVNTQEMRAISVAEALTLNGVSLTEDSQEFVQKAINSQSERNRNLSNH